MDLACDMLIALPALEEGYLRVGAYLSTGYTDGD